MVGFGSIGKGALPLILRHLAVDREPHGDHRPRRFSARDRRVRGRSAFLSRRSSRKRCATCSAAARRGRLPGEPLRRGVVGRTDRAVPGIGALYIDTCIEPPPGGYTDPSKSLSERSNYALREVRAGAAARRAGSHRRDRARRESRHGEPSSSSARCSTWRAISGMPAAAPDDPRVGAAGAGRRRQRHPYRRARHAASAIAEGARTSSSTPGRSPASFPKGLQPAELGWGTHEKALPPEGERHKFGCGASIYLSGRARARACGAGCRKAGPIQGYLITA